MPTDYRLTADDLRANHLPQELEAYPYYPEGIHIPVSEVGTIIVTDPWESDKPAETHCTLGVYDYEMSGASEMIDLLKTELESAVIHLMCDIKHDEHWITNAIQQISKWFDEGRG